MVFSHIGERAASSAHTMSRSFGRFDLHAKAIEGSQKQSLVGAAITIVSALVMLSLFCTELQFYTTTSIKNRLYVDVARGKNQIRVNLNLSFPELACDAVHLDVEDAKGQKTLNADRMGTLHKHPLFGGERHLAETLVRTAADAALLKAQATERVHGKKRVVGSGEGSGSEDGATGRRRRRRRRWRRLRGRRIRGEIENRTTHKRQRGREVEKHQFS